jgi:hypothetical protein
MEDSRGAVQIRLQFVDGIRNFGREESCAFVNASLTDSIGVLRALATQKYQDCGNVCYQNKVDISHDGKKLRVCDDRLLICDALHLPSTDVCTIRVVGAHKPDFVEHTVSADVRRINRDSRLTRGTAVDFLSDEANFNRLLGLLPQLPSHEAHLIWQLMMELPTNGQRAHSVAVIGQGVDGREVWPSELTGEAVPASFQLYTLQIMYAHVLDNDDDHTVRERWKSLGVIDVLRSIVKAQCSASASSDGNRYCFNVLLVSIRLLQIFQNTFQAGPRVDELVQDMLSLIENVSRGLCPRRDSSDLHTIRAVVLRCAACLVVNAVLDQPRLLPAFLERIGMKADDGESWLAHVLLKPHAIAKSASVAISFELQRLCTKWSTPVSAQIQTTPGQALLARALDEVDRDLSPFATQCGGFFTLLDHLITTSEPSGLSGSDRGIQLLDVEQCAKLLVHRLENHRSVETLSNSAPDVALCGILLAITRVLCIVDAACCAAIRSDCGSRRAVVDFREFLCKQRLLQILWRDCLFEDRASSACEAPTSSSSSSSSSSSQITKCMQPLSRQYAFALLKHCCRVNGTDSDVRIESGSLMSELLGYMSKQQSEGPATVEGKTKSIYVPSTVARSASGHVGLSNLGATCYMNALLQQLYMIRSFRYTIENNFTETPQAVSESDDATRGSTLLFQLQKVFLFLSHSKKRACSDGDMLALFTAISAWNLHPEDSDATQQQDADEFFNRLADRIDNSLQTQAQARARAAAADADADAAGSSALSMLPRDESKSNDKEEDSSLFQRLFEGTISNQLLPTCGHKKRSQRALLSPEH